MKKKLSCYTPVSPIIIGASLLVKLFYVFGIVFIVYKIYKYRYVKKTRNIWITALLLLVSICAIWYLVVPGIIEKNTPQLIDYLDSGNGLALPNSGCGSGDDYVELFR